VLLFNWLCETVCTAVEDHRLTYFTDGAGAYLIGHVKSWKTSAPFVANLSGKKEYRFSQQGGATALRVMNSVTTLHNVFGDGMINGLCVFLVDSV
jgi:hypothetical protein